jgi:F420-dependent oxidoreductase-like protein
VRTGIQIGGEASGRTNDWAQIVAYVKDAERLGIDTCWTAEAWGQDSLTPLAYLAGVTEQIGLGTCITQISARVPAMTAMSAMTIATMSDNRFILGLGVSGPQVVEGLHGIAFDHPLRRLQETVDILRLAFAGERIEYQGRHHTLPRPGGPGKALRMSQPANLDIPIYFATLAPAGLAYTGAAADGWLGTSFSPATASLFLDPIAAGAEQAGRTLADVVIDVPAPVAFGDDIEALLPPYRSRLAFTLGAMGSRQQNFYNAAFRRAGWEEVAEKVQALWLGGKRVEAAAAVPAELVLATTMIGSDDDVRARLRAYRDAGANALRLAPAGDTWSTKLDTLGRVLDLVRDVSAEG